MKVVAVVVTHNHAGTIIACLKSLSGQVDEILIIDSASTDDTVSLIQKQFPHISLEKSQQNIGYAKGNNWGIEKALKLGADYIFILNPDIVLDKKCIKNHLFHVETHVTSRILGPKIYFKDSRFSAKGGLVRGNDQTMLWSVGGELDEIRWTAKLIGFGEKDQEQYESERQVDFISGTCMLIPRKVLEQGLRFHEPYFLYYEDVEFCVRATKLGFPSYVVPQAKIFHYETSQTNLTPKDYYLARNHLLFVERNAPLHIKLREILRLPKTLKEHYKKGDKQAIKGIRDYFLRKFSAKPHSRLHLPLARAKGGQASPLLGKEKEII